MTAIAGVRNAGLLGEERIRNREPVIMPPVTLHVGGLRHVTVDTFTAGFLDRLGIVNRQIEIGLHSLCVIAKYFVMAVGDRFDYRSVGIAAVMATHAEPVARQDCLQGMRVVTIHAINPPEMHPGSEE